MKDDIEWWFHFSEMFNGKAAIVQSYFMSDLTSDASRTGFAIYTDFDLVAGVWSDDIDTDTPCQHIVKSPKFDVFDSANINVLELWPILVGLHRWCTLLRNSRIRVWVDNMQVLYMLKTGRSSNPTCMYWLREIFWLSVLFNFSIEPNYIPSEANIVADTLSRLSYPKTAKNLSNLVSVDQMCCSELLLDLSMKFSTETSLEDSSNEEERSGDIDSQGAS